MPRPIPVDYLQDDERVVHQAGRHPLSVIDEVLGGVVLAAIPIAAALILTRGFFPQWWLPLGLPLIVVVCALLLAFVVARWFRVATSWYTITDQRVYRSHGRLRFFLSQTTYDKLTDLHVKQSLFGRMWGFGTLRLETAGTGIALDGVRNPLAAKRRLERARTAFLLQLVGEAAPAIAESSPQMEEEVGEQASWSAGPTPAAFLGNFLGVVVMVIFAAVGLVAATLSAWQALIIPAALLIAAVSTSVGVWVRLRYTRYHLARRGVFVTSGWLSRRRVETTFTKVTDVTVYQGLLGRLLDFGTITINTAGSSMAPVVFAGVARPEEVKDRIDQARREARE